MPVALVDGSDEEIHREAQQQWVGLVRGQQRGRSGERLGLGCFAGSPYIHHASVGDFRRTIIERITALTPYGFP
jgi:hypothetical protein